jgi:hypothetical protein
MEFSWFFWQQMVGKSIIFHTFFETDDLAKISVSPRWEHDFRGSEPPKMRAKSLGKSHQKKARKISKFESIFL